MITLTIKEWQQNKEDWAKNMEIGSRVMVYDKPMVYNKKRTPISVLGKFELREGGQWVKLQ